MNTPGLEFWFEFGSTYSYVAADRIEDVAGAVGYPFGDARACSQRKSCRSGDSGARRGAPARFLMRQTADVVFPFEGRDGKGARCRVRVYEPEDPRDAPVVVCSELPAQDPGGVGVVGAVSTIAARVAAAFRLYRKPVWIEHRPSPGPETFELVTFAVFRAREIRRMGPRLLCDL